MNRLKVELAGLELSNPTMLASGMMGETGMSLVEAARNGAGAVVTKSVGMEPRTGYINPTLVEHDDYYINAMGLPNPGIADYGEEMASAIKGGVPIFGSIFAASVSDFAHLAGKMEDYGASAVELNLSCPHAKGYGMEMGIDPDIVANIVKEVKGSVSVPVFAKLTPNTHRLLDVAEAVQRADGDGIVAINTLKAIAISVEFRRPILSNVYGGLSGPAVKPIGLRAVYDLYDRVDIPIIGVGGVETWKDAMEYIMAGASAVQVGSAVGRHGLGVFGEICNGMDSYLEENGAEMMDLVGVAHERK
ncbi:MAG: dihydroorotate dehydrogenase 1B [Methanomassiliicoccales archaeon PtaU1.Bin124]|nr:MAG: dihydroorotate dehydrogenase 1B [Methanomassiliicoccales archaeon PtaU1.Bin124]